MMNTHATKTCKNHPSIEALIGDLCGFCSLLEERKHHDMTPDERKRFEERYYKE